MALLGDFALDDPSTYTTKKGGLPSVYSYRVNVNYTSKTGQSKIIPITIHNLDTLTEDEITSQAEVIALGSGRRYQDIASIDSIDITQALKSADLEAQ